MFVFREGENGSAIEKVEEVKKINRKRRNSWLYSSTFGVLLGNIFHANLERVVSTGAWTELEVGASKEKKKQKNTGMVDSRFARTGCPGITRH